MYVVVRSYSGQGASELFDLLGQREEEIKSLIGGVPGFVSYAAFRSGGDAGQSRMARQGRAQRAAQRRPRRPGTAQLPGEIASGRRSGTEGECGPAERALRATNGPTAWRSVSLRHVFEVT